MMDTYMSSTVAFRSKASSAFSDFCLLNEGLHSSSPWAAFAVNGFSVNPRFLYGLRQSTLIRWSSSRNVILGGNGYWQLATPCHCDRAFRVYHPPNERIRERRVASVVCERGGSDMGDETNVQEMLSLLTDSCEKPENYVRKRNARLEGERSRKIAIHREGSCEVKKNGRLDVRSRKGGNSLDPGPSRRSSTSEIMIKSREEYRGTRKESSLGEENQEARRDGSSTSYYSVSSGGDLESSAELISMADGGVPSRSNGHFQVSSVDNLQVKHKKVVGVNSGHYEDYSREDQVDTFEGRADCFQKHEDVKQHGERLKGQNAEVDLASVESMRRKSGITSDLMVSSSEWGSAKESEKLAGLSKFQAGDNQRASNSQMLTKVRLKDKEDNSTSSGGRIYGASEKYMQNDEEVVAQTESRKQYQKLTRTSAINDDNTQKTSRNQKLLNTQIKLREENISSDLVGGERLQYSGNDQRAARQTESRKKSQELTEESDVSNTDAEKISSSQRLSRTITKDRENNSTSNLNLNLVQQASELHIHMDQHQLLDRQTESRNQSHTQVSEAQKIDSERRSSSQRVSRTEINDQEENSSSTVNVVQETRERHNRTDERVVGRFGSRKEAERLTKRLDSYESDTERASSSQKILKIKIKDHVENSAELLKSEEREQPKGPWTAKATTSEVMVIPPRSQMVQQDSATQHKPTVHVTQDGVSSTSDSQICKLDDRTRKDEMDKERTQLIVDNDALGSATRLDTASAQFLGEFVDKARQEISTSHEFAIGRQHTSENQKWTSSEGVSNLQRTLDAASTSQDENIEQGFTRYGSENFQVELHGSRLSSAGTGPKGPSDEIWDVVGPSSEEPSGTETLEGGSASIKMMELTGPAKAGDALVKRSGKSLWSYIGHILRMGWGARAESHNSSPKPGAKSSPHGSLSSEDWFSGPEPDDDDDGKAKRGRKGTPKEPLLIKISDDRPHPRTTPTHSKEGSGATSFKDKVTQVEAATLSSVGTLEGGSTFKLSSLVSTEDSFRRNEDRRGRQTLVSAGSLLPSTGSSSSSCLKAATDKEEISESSKGQVPRSHITELLEEPKEKVTEANAPEGKDGELKRRKLQRNKQVLKERFDEWEEAFKLDHEQRKLDEMFMREALFEAKKAADTWEVPVGAVLVQGGKIIARGCNLVEELRDSTAHAEMICIREASNLLRTWRLAETTLYVTLEPCAMCAGAILQARIDTVVWGAPNKLLGADGSWVSLFPGEEGSNGSDQSNRQAGPVHPFHPKITIRRGVLVTECADVMQQFFQLRRRKNKKQEEPSPSCLHVSNHPTKFFSKMRDIFTMMFCL